MNKNEIVIFETEDKSIVLPVTVESETVWLNRNQMAELFGRYVKTIGKHINNSLKEELDESGATVAKFATVQMEGEREVERYIEYYNLDVIISVGYRVKSKRGVEFRRWANSVLKQYILKGYAVNDNRIKQLGEVIRIMKRTEHNLDSEQVLSVIEQYSKALDLLDSYDHQNMTRPKGNEAIYVLDYEECMQVIESMWNVWITLQIRMQPGTRLHLIEKENLVGKPQKLKMKILDMEEHILWKCSAKM